MKLLLTITTVLFSTLIFAQKINIKTDIVYVDDSAYCKLINQKSTDAKEYIIATVNDTQIIYVREGIDDDYVTLTFLATNKKAKLLYSKTGAFNKKIFLKMLFKHKLIEGNGINEINKNIILAKYADEELIENPTIIPDNGMALVIRDTEAEITIIGKIIKQDGKTIGTLVYKNYMDDDANSIVKYVFALPNKTNVAELKVNEFYAEKNTFITIKDNKSHRLKVEAGIFHSQEDVVLLEAVKYLVRLKYM
jgi:hypothetical protein